MVSPVLVLQNIDKNVKMGYYRIDSENYAIF